MRNIKFKKELSETLKIYLRKKDADEAGSEIMRLLDKYNFREEQIYEDKGYI